MDKKNTMLLTVIAVATLLVAVVGATFAYFSVSNPLEKGETTVTGTTATPGVVSLSSGSNTTATISAEDMDQKNKGNNVYITNANATHVAQTAGAGDLITFATISASKGSNNQTATYSCTGTITVDTAGTDMTLESGEGGNAFLQFKTVEGIEAITTDAIDLKDVSGWSSKPISFDITTDAPISVTGNVWVVNKSDAQTTSDLAGKTLSVKVTVTGLDCQLAAGD